MKKILITVMVSIITALTCTSILAATYTESSKTLADINAIYYLIGDNTSLKNAGSSTSNVKYVPTSKQSGFEDIDIIVEGSVGEKYTLVFGVNSDPGSTAEITLAGTPITNPYVEWIPLDQIGHIPSHEYGELYSSNEKGVVVRTAKRGVKTFVDSQEFVQAAGVIIEFVNIGKTDNYSVMAVTLTGTDGLIKTYRILCHNRHVETGDTILVDEAPLNNETGYYEINGLFEPFNNGKVLNASTVNAMRDSGNKYAIFMSNGVTLLIDRISKTTVEQGEITLRTNANINNTLRGRFSEAAGGSIITFSIESGFINDTVTYALDMYRGDVTKGMPVSEQDKWTDGKKVFCYLVDKAEVETLANGGDTDVMIDSEKMLPCEIKDEILYIKTTAATFNAEEQMMMCTLKEMDTAGNGSGSQNGNNIPVYNVAFNVNGGSSIDAQAVYHGDNATEPMEPTKAGHRFVGWYADEAFTTMFNFDTGITTDTTIYAKWEANTYTVTFNSNKRHRANTNANASAADIYINGEKHTVGDTGTITENGKAKTIVTVDSEKLEELIESEGDRVTVTISVTDGSDSSSVVMSGQMVKNIEDKKATLKLETGAASYTIPARKINIDALVKQLGENIDLSKIKVEITISEPSDDMIKIVEKAAEEGGFTLMIQAVEFAVTCIYNGTTLTNEKFNGYVERTIEIPEGVDPDEITTAIIVDPDGTTRHVPTQVRIINGKYCAVINSLTNSVYTLICNPIKFPDVQGHWAQVVVNDMASRKIINGHPDGFFVPNGNITRAEFVTIIIRALGIPASTGSSSFGDVDVNDWYCGAVEMGVNYELLKGYSDDTYGPEDKITREQAMTIIARALTITGLDVNTTDSEISLDSFTDGSDVSAYAREGVAACIDTGIITARGNNKLAPKDYMTRAETAVIAKGLLKQSGLI